MKSNYKAYKAEKTLGQLTKTQQKIVTDFVTAEVNRMRERLGKKKNGGDVEEATGDKT